MAKSVFTKSSKNKKTYTFKISAELDQRKRNVDERMKKLDGSSRLDINTYLEAEFENIIARAEKELAAIEQK